MPAAIFMLESSKARCSVLGVRCFLYCGEDEMFGVEVKKGCVSNHGDSREEMHRKFPQMVRNFHFNRKKNVAVDAIIFFPGSKHIHASAIIHN